MSNFILIDGKIINADQILYAYQDRYDDASTTVVFRDDESITVKVPLTEFYQQGSSE